MNEDEAEKRYQAFLQREKEQEAKKGLTQLQNPNPPTQLLGMQETIIELKDTYPEAVNAFEVAVKKEQEARAAEVTQALKATMKKNLLDSFYIELQIATGNEKEVAANRKLRYEFAKRFVQSHWRACVSAGLKIKDLLNV